MNEARHKGYLSQPSCSFASQLMSLVSGFATYKKKAGLLTLREDQIPPILQWKAADDSVPIPLVEFALSTITNMKASVATSDVMKLVVITTPAEGADPVNYVFAFNNRLVMDNVKEALQQIVARYRTAVQASESQTNTTAAGTPLINTTSLTDSLSSRELLKNLNLQHELLLEDKQLKATFEEAVIRQGLDAAEFWKTRVHLLRAFALTNSQKIGPYNVLSTIKPTATSDNQVNVDVNIQKIHVIFEQYPVVRKAYDDNVPKISEGDFWARFFNSKLFRKLRGEKISSNLRGDYMLDKYINMDVDYEQHEDELLNHKVSKAIDLEGNQEDDSSKLGNAPDITMKPNAIPETISVLRSMNRLSQKMVNSLEHQYSRSATPEVSKSREQIENEKIREELLFQDLEVPHRTEYSEINVRQDTSETHDHIKRVTREEYAHAAEKIKRQFEEDFDLPGVYQQSKKHAIETAAKDVSELVKLNSKQSKQSWQVYKSLEEQANHQVVDEVDPTFNKNILEQLRITHGTSVEFLRHFWLHFNSGDPSQANSLKTLYQSVHKSQERIKAAIESVPDLKSKEKALAYFRPLIQSLKTAVKAYQDALKEETTSSA